MNYSKLPVVVVSSTYVPTQACRRNIYLYFKSSVQICTSSSVGVQSIAINVSVCPSVCLSVCLFICLSCCLFICPLAHPKDHTSKFHHFYVRVTCVARSSADGDAIRYVLSVLWMTSCLHKTKRMGQNQRRLVCFVQFARWLHRG